MASRSLTLVLSGILVIVSIGAGLLGSVHRAKANPAVTYSRYIGGLGAWTETDFYNMGCARGAAVQVGAVILAFGQPYYQSGQGYGVIALGNGQFMSTNTIKLRAQSFAQGFYQCANGSAYVTLIIGTSNYGSYWTSDTTHASEWAYMVTQVQNYITSQGYSSRIQAAAGSDIELDATQGWSSYSVTKSWVQAYDSVNTKPLYNFGSADACPSTQTNHLTGQTATSLPCHSGWTQDGVAYVSWRNPAAYPFPEIYTEGSPYSSQAIQWQRISNYSKRKYGVAMMISGVLTQRGACDYNGGPSACPGTYNSPNQGYDQMWNALQYLDSGYVAHSPQWLSDITW